MTGPLVSYISDSQGMAWWGWEYAWSNYIDAGVLGESVFKEAPLGTQTPPEGVTGIELSFPAPGYTGEIRMGDECLAVSDWADPRQYPLRFVPCLEGAEGYTHFYVDADGGVWWDVYGDGNRATMFSIERATDFLPFPSDGGWTEPAPVLTVGNFGDNRTFMLYLPGMTLENGAGAVTARVDGVDGHGVVAVSGEGFPGATVTVRDGEMVVGTAVAAEDGTWSVSTTALPAGEYTLTATQDSPVAGGSASVDVIVGEVETPVVDPLIAGGALLLSAAVAGAVVVVRRRRALLPG